MLNKSIKVTYIAIGIYALLYFLLPIRRTLYLWQEHMPELGDFLFNKGEFMLLVLIATIAIVVLLYPRTSVASILNRLTQPKVLVAACVITLIACLTATFLRIPGLWWTWHSVGMYAGTVFLIALLLRNRIPAGGAFMFGCGCAIITMSVWEIVYQYGFWYFYTEPQGAPFNAYLGVVRFMLPFILVGLVILLSYERRHRILQLNAAALICVTLTIGCLAYWFASGLWCDALCDWSSGLWYSNPESNSMSLAVYRSSKIFFNLMFAALIWRSSRFSWLSKRVGK